MTAILKEEPNPVSTENKEIPPAVERIVLHCLEKNPSERFQSARDLAFDLESLSGISAATTAAGADRGTSSSQKWLIPLAALALLGMGAALDRLIARRTDSFAPRAFEQLTFKRGFLYSARFAPDGNSVVYSASWEGQRPGLYSMRLDSPESRPLDVNNSVLLAVSTESELAISRECKYLVTGKQIISGRPLPLEEVLEVGIGIARGLEAAHSKGIIHRDIKPANIRYGEQQLTVRVRDDGKGIGPGTLEAKGRAGHWGLPGMRELASKIGVQLELWSRPESGTEMELKIPAATAYQSRRAWGNWFSSRRS